MATDAAVERASGRAGKRRTERERDRAGEREKMFTTPTGPSRKRSATEAGSVPSGGQSGAALATPSRLRCIADLKGELTCNICLDVCVKPCTTPCGHNFCQRCLQALYRAKRGKQQQQEPGAAASGVECPKCRTDLGSAPVQEVNSALWNVIQMLFPRLELKSPQWKHVKSPVPFKGQMSGMGGAPIPFGSPLSGTFEGSARLMLHVSDFNEQDITEGPVLDLSNRRANFRPSDDDDAAPADSDGGAGSEVEERGGEGGRGGDASTAGRAEGEAETAVGGSAAAGEERAVAAAAGSDAPADATSDEAGEGNVPRVGFMTAREMMMRINSQQRAPHEIMDYA